MYLSPAWTSIRLFKSTVPYCYHFNYWNHNLSSNYLTRATSSFTLDPPRYHYCTRLVH